MNSSTSALLALTSPPFDSTGDRRLTGAVVSRASLTPAEQEQMYNLLANYFSGTSRGQFEADLAEKESVILLRDVIKGQIRGFSTLMRLAACVDGEEIVAFFSGDTIVAHQYWGETVLSRLWTDVVFEEADRLAVERPASDVYWFLICSGYKTWRFLPVFFREFYPNPEESTPPRAKRILDTLGELKFGKLYCRETGVVRLCSGGSLRRGVADVTEERLRDPRVAFFARMNPGHADGDELACLTKISRANLTPAGERVMCSRRRQSKLL